MTNVDHFKRVTEEMCKLYEKKNHDYGDSFHISFAEDGLVMSKIRLGDKYNRFKSLLKGNQQVADESIRDTLIDMANYAVMTIIELDRKDKGND